MIQNMKNFQIMHEKIHFKPITLTLFYFRTHPIFIENHLALRSKYNRTKHQYHLTICILIIEPIRASLHCQLRIRIIAPSFSFSLSFSYLMNDLKTQLYFDFLNTHHHFQIFIFWWSRITRSSLCSPSSLVAHFILDLWKI